MFEFAMRFETASEKSSMKWMAFSKEARVTLFCLSLKSIFNLNKKSAAETAD
jgi:hypothetical protein